MFNREELRQRIRDMLAEEQIDEANANDLPAMLILKRGAVRTLSDGKRVAEYHHADSGTILVFPMIFQKETKQ